MNIWGLECRPNHVEEESILLENKVCQEEDPDSRGATNLVGGEESSTPLLFDSQGGRQQEGILRFIKLVWQMWLEPMEEKIRKKRERELHGHLRAPLHGHLRAAVVTVILVWTAKKGTEVLGEEAG